MPVPNNPSSFVHRQNDGFQKTPWFPSHSTRAHGQSAAIRPGGDVWKEMDIVEKAAQPGCVYLPCFFHAAIIAR